VIKLVTQTVTYTTRNKHKERTSKPCVEFELAIQGSNRPQTFASGRTATYIDTHKHIVYTNFFMLFTAEPEVTFV
jgi:hypothetical protein